MSDQHAPARPRLDATALHGLAGDVVRIIEPHTEADPAAILVQFLVAAGNAMGPSRYFTVEAAAHHTNLYASIVGQSSKARKGTSYQWVARLVKEAAPEWSACIQKGLSSGEGLIFAVRDGTSDDDAGVSDKRLLVVESELVSVLKRMSRDGNTLSALIREAWDTGDLQSMTKVNPAKATGAHVSIIAHITIEELRRSLNASEMTNGLANRFLWAYAMRSKSLPEGGSLDLSSLTSLSSRLARALSFASEVGEVKRSQKARAVWASAYEELSTANPGMYGAATSRAEAQVTRLSLIYALLDSSAVIEEVHLFAALALWQYTEASAHLIFGDALEDPTADAILNALRGRENGMTRTEIIGLLSRHVKAVEITRAVESLRAMGLAATETVKTGGRPSERWFAMDTAGADLRQAS